MTEPPLVHTVQITHPTHAVHAGIIHCQILEGQLEDAAQQLEFLGEVRASLGKLPELLYLEALLSHHQGQPQSEVVAKLEEAALLHFEQVKVVTPATLTLYCAGTYIRTSCSSVLIQSL